MMYKIIRISFYLVCTFPVFSQTENILPLRLFPYKIKLNKELESKFLKEFSFDDSSNSFYKEIESDFGFTMLYIWFENGKVIEVQASGEIEVNADSLSLIVNNLLDYLISLYAFPYTKKNGNNWLQEMIIVPETNIRVKDMEEKMWILDTGIQIKLVYLPLKSFEYHRDEIQKGMKVPINLVFSYTD